MRPILLAFLLLGCLLCSGRTQTQYLQFSLDPVIVSRANFYLNILATQVRTYNWVNCNRVLLSNTLANTLTWLRKIRNALPTGNILDGTGNAVTGTNNIVVGSRNQVRGMNNWVFVSNYRPGQGITNFMDSILAIGNYQIDLTKADQVARNPPAAISMIDDKKYEELCKKNVATSFFFRN
jgi:hypothetical protein